MTFWQQVSATLIGTVAGFVFSLVLFYVSEKLKARRAKDKILTGLRRELTFDRGLAESWLKVINDTRAEVSAGNKNTFPYVDYTRFLSIFIVQAVRDGLLYDLLTDDELIALDMAMRGANPGQEQDFITKHNAWKAGTVSSPEMMQVLNSHKFNVETVKRGVERVLAKLK